MQRWRNIGFNFTICLNSILLLFVLAGSKLQVPAWLQVTGRMHPLLLHFPIVLIILYIFWTVFLQAKTKTVLTGPEDEIGKWLLLSTAFTAALTAVMGFLLSKEQGYSSEALWWHQWGGVAVSLFSLFWYTCRNSIHRRRYLPQIAALVSFILIVFTGHQGSNITHGENYLLAPVTPEKRKPVVPIEQAIVYTDMVKPILESKCITCHNSKKAKGELVMETEALLLKGGKHGVLWTGGQPDVSLLMQRIHLPASEKKHMPPAGKPQLDEEEIATIFQWIKRGASFKQKVLDLPVNDSLRLLANQLFNEATEESFDFPAASDKEISRLNNTNRLIHPVAANSPALSVNFYNRQYYTTAALKELLSLKAQIVSVNMAYMPLKEEDLKILSQFNQLRDLNVNFSTVPNQSLAVLSVLPNLKHLSVSGTKAGKKDIEQLARFPKLRSVYLWNTAITAAELQAVRKLNANIQFEMGFMNDSVLLKLNPPVLETDQRIIKDTALAIRLKHFIKGVVIHYTTDGSTPDSIQSPAYNNDLVLNKTAVLKARAFKKGWIGSDSITANFFKNTFTADSIRSLTALDSLYKGSLGARTLINGEKGPQNFSGSGQWLGFRRNKMEMLLHYAAPVTVSSVTLSALVNIGGFIMPPAIIEIWGGTTERNLVRLSAIKPQQPDTLGPSYMRGFDCKFKPAHVKFIKVIAVPVAALPSWHPGKGQKAWLFTDEIFVN